ncbi:MAG TPA: endopeptidase La, partial [Rhodobiaceae bacterium]|nr:endopeptidase La [Rhodobiaceae bacterium]
MSDTTDTTDYTKFPEVLAVLPLRNIVVFPGMIVPLFVGRDKSIRALEDVMADDKQIMLVAQRDGDLDDPSEEDVYDIGTVGTILQLLKLPDGTVKVLVEGLRRARLVDFVPNESFFQASVIGIEEEDLDSPDLSSLSKTVVGQFDNYVKMNRKIPQEVQNVIREIDDPQKLADTVAGHLNIQISEKQALLENVSVSERLENVLGHMENEVGLLQVEKKIRGRVKRQMEKTQREYYLNEQLKAIQKELGEGEDGMDDLAELEAQIEKTKFSKEAREKAQAEFKKLKNMSPMSAEATVV